MLTAIHDQTAEFEWKGLQRAIAAKLGIDENCSSTLGENCMNGRLSNVVLEGLLSALSMVQRFPEDHVLQIETGLSVCAVVTWTHLLLGLNVVVRKPRAKSCEEFVFGARESANVVVTIHSYLVLPMAPHYAETADDTVVLLSSTTGEPIFSLRQEDRSELLVTTRVDPARAYGLEFMRKWFPGRGAGSDKAMDEMAHVATAFAFCFAQLLCVRLRTSPDGVMETVSKAQPSSPLQK